MSTASPEFNNLEQCCPFFTTNWTKICFYNIDPMKALIDILIMSTFGKAFWGTSMCFHWIDSLKANFCPVRWVCREEWTTLLQVIKFRTSSCHLVPDRDSGASFLNGLCQLLEGPFGGLQCWIRSPETGHLRVGQFAARHGRSRPSPRWSHGSSYLW
jgi:hypothetical protein